VAEPEADPRGAEYGRGDRDGRGLARRRDRSEEEGEREDDQETPEKPLGAPELGAEERGDGPAVPGENERPERARHAVELVERHEPSGGDERKQEPAAEVGEAENERQPGDRNRHARYE
jgi:hypothetical protein